MDPEEVSRAGETTEEPTIIEEAEEEKPVVKNPTEPKLAKVEYDYEATQSDELSLQKGDVITVLEQNEGWWKGDLNGKIGIFPANHVKLIEVPGQSVEYGEEAENPEGVKKKTLNKYGVKPGGLGSLFSGGVPTLKKRSQPSPESSSASEEKHAIASPPVIKKTSLPSPVNQQPNLPLHLPPKKKPPKPKKTEQKAEVIFDYEAEANDEISLKTGTLVAVLEKIDDGWWTGRNEQGQTGMFPSTYVKEINQDEVQQESQSTSEVTVEEIDRHDTSEASVMIMQQVLSSEPVPVSTDSPPSSIHSGIYEIHSEDSPTLPKSPPSPMKRTTNESSSPPTPNRRSTHESSQTASPRRSTHESTSPTSPRRNSSYDRDELVTSKRPPSLVSLDLPPIQSISANIASADTAPISPEERPIAPPRQSSRPSSLYENKTESQKSPILAKPPTIPKNFSPAKPPAIPPVKKSSSSVTKSDKVKSETSPTEPISPEITKPSYDQYDSSTVLSEQSEPENKFEDEKQAEVEKREEIDREAEVSDEEVKEINTETLDIKNDDDTISGNEVELEENKSQQLPTLPSGPKLTNLGKDRPVIKNRKPPSIKSVKENAIQSQNAILLEAVASTKDEVEQKPQLSASPTLSKPEKPEKPVKPNTFKLPTLGTGIQLRSVAKKPPIETSTDSTEIISSSTASSGIDTKPISGGVKGISSRFNQFSGIPNSSDIELRLKKWFNEEINKVKSNFEAKLAEERNKREALEEEFRELIARIQEN